MRRRDFIQGVAGASLAGLGTAVLPRLARAQGKGRVVVASYGGSYQDAQREIFFKRFQQATGIEVVDVPGVALAKIRAMAKAGHMEWDLIPTVEVEIAVLSDEGLLEKIDYSKLDPKSLAAIDKKLQHDYGVGYLYFSQVMAFNTKAMRDPAKRPQSWADFWDAKKFPGSRLLPAGDYTVNPIEPALLADGVAPKDLYPIDLKRAYKSLTRIKPDVSKWYDSGGAPGQAVADGSATMVMANAARIQDLMNQKAPVDFTWNEGILQTTNWSIPKGAANYDNAMRLIDFALKPEQQAAFVKLQPSGPSNRDAFGLIPAEERKRYPSAPENLSKQVAFDANWWSTKTGAKTNLEINSEMWRKWMVS